MSSEVAPVPEPDDVPVEHCERVQWLMWDAANDSPRRPHWRGDFGISWTDPDDWHSFEEAREAALERDSWGIGYVFAKGNDDYPRGIYGALDLDGCADENGRPKEWLPSLKPFADRDAYIEWSPSSTGLHIPLAGFEPPEWWSDSHFTDDEHEGVEAYGSKFFTVTGDRLRGAGDTVADTGEWVTEWLAQVHKSITGDDPRDRGTEGDSAGSDPGGSAADEWMNADVARAALEHVDPDVGYPTWRDIGFALADEFSSGTALAVFEDWSRGGTQWDDDAPALAESIIKGATDGGGRSIATVVHHAKQGGWDASAAAREATVADGGTATTTATSASAEAEPDDADDGDGDDDEWPLRPSSVAAFAGLGEDDSISDLDDRQKAACVWGVIGLSDRVHVRVRRDNGALWAYDGGIWTPDGERVLRHAARQALGPMNYGANVLAELKAQARSDPVAEIDADDLGLEPGTLAVENGLLDLDAVAEGVGEAAIRELRPDDLALARLPVEYDPDPDADAGEWAEHVEEWAESGKADALQEYVGYCLEVGDMPIHRAVLLVGSGANGKGTFLSVVRALLGEENTTSIELQTLANERDARADFYGSIANIDDDLSARSLGRGLGMFKKLVAGDRVRGRHLYEGAFEFNATGKHLYAANEVPDVSGDVGEDDEAFWRRWTLVEFPNHYPQGERDPDLRDRLTEAEALSGVLNWAIEGRRRLLEQGYFTGEERDAQAKRERWQAWGDSLDKFISECVERDPDAPNITTGDAHRRYAAWCRATGERPVGQHQLTTTLKNEDVGYAQSVRVDGRVQRGYKALALSDAVPALAETPERAADPAPDGDLRAYDDESDGETEPQDTSDTETDDESDGSDLETIAVRTARVPISEAVAELETDDAGASISVVLEQIPHREAKGREHIEAMIEAGTLERTDDGRLRSA